MNQALEILQEVHLIHNEYRDQPHLAVAILAGGALLIALGVLCVVAVGSITLLAGSVGLLKEEKSAPLPERHKIRVIR